MLTIEPAAARAIVDLVASEGAAPEGGLRVQALAGSSPEQPMVTVSVSPSATEIDTVFVDEDTAARVFVDQATADVVDGRTLSLEEREPPRFAVR
ncbi:hypothetical protein M8542_49400 [Amycolatopsis sp. OK19-0408]|uniref:Fe-S cluster assembly iron-binding protein IscA n=1 Tax=Amycolatopsis iheyensis TaxID=2945988 RepID=A0A9X2NMJ0_9PSEU|nr:hypothetical protein [Amycolatopsis iheyensis]MCR6490828.1 hypothetical protein [Amycolatopsis iheyensis]